VRALSWATGVLLAGGGAGVFAITQGYIGAPSKVEFIAMADAICGQSNQALRAIPTASAYPDLVKATTTMLTTTEGQLGRLRSLPLPGGADRGPAKAVLSAMSATNLAGHSLHVAAMATDDARTAAATRSMTFSAKDATARAAEYGFTACGTGMQPGVDSVAGGGKGIVKAAFVTKASALCKAAGDAVEAVPGPKGDPSDLRQYIDKTMGLMDTMTANLRALPAPPGDEAELAEIFAAVDKTNAKGREMTGPATAGDLKRLDAVRAEINTLGDAAVAKFDTYGVPQCGSAG